MTIIATDKSAEFQLAFSPIWLQLDSDLGAKFFMAVVTSAQTVWPNKREVLNKTVTHRDIFWNSVVAQPIKINFLSWNWIFQYLVGKNQQLYHFLTQMNTFHSPHRNYWTLFLIFFSWLSLSKCLLHFKIFSLKLPSLLPRVTNCR